MIRWLPERPLILASKSRSRLELIEVLGISVEAVVSDVREREIEDRLISGSSSELALELAKAKSLAVAARDPSRWVLGCDQVLEHRSGVVHKAADRQAMAEKLQEFASSSHLLHSGCVLSQGNVVRATICSTSQITFRAISDAEIEAYIDANLETGILASVGSYHFEAAGIGLIERVEGGKSAIMGLPVLDLVRAFQEIGLVDVGNG